jgi:FkbM family methyltransferase
VRALETLDRAYGLVRSLAVYYGQVWRRGRMEAFYGAFLKPGDLAFDVGSHVGNRVRAWRHLGARVVAVEPQPDFLAVLRAFYGRNRDVIIEDCAVGAERGEATLHISTRTPTVSTLSRGWIDDVQRDPRFGVVRWDSERRVRVVTLDDLVARHGEPAFCKIDVEGFELEVLRGLTRPLRALSFEYIPVAVERSVACIERVAAIGDYRFRHSRVETMRWAAPRWAGAAEMIATLRALDVGDRSGDVYALLASEVHP